MRYMTYTCTCSKAYTYARHLRTSRIAHRAHTHIPHRSRTLQNYIAHRDTQTRTHLAHAHRTSHSLAFTYTQAYTHKKMCTPSRLHTRSHTHMQSHSRPCTCTRHRTNAHAHAHAHAHALSQSHVRSRLFIRGACIGASTWVHPAHARARACIRMHER